MTGLSRESVNPPLNPLVPMSFAFGNKRDGTNNDSHDENSRNSKNSVLINVMISGKIEINKGIIMMILTAIFIIMNIAKLAKVRPRSLFERWVSACWAAGTSCGTEAGNIGGHSHDEYASPLQLFI